MPSPASTPATPSRPFSWRYGTTGEYRRFDSFNFTHLSGSYFRSVAGAHGFSARRWLEGETLVRLGRLGVGTVRWVVKRRRLAAARAHASDLLRDRRHPQRGSSATALGDTC